MATAEKKTDAYKNKLKITDLKLFNYGWRGDIQNNNHHPPVPPPTVTYSISVSHHLRLREIKSKQHNPSDHLSDVKTEQSFSNPLHSILPTMEESTALCEGEPLQYYSLENQHGSEAHTW